MSEHEEKNWIQKLRKDYPPEVLDCEISVGQGWEDLLRQALVWMHGILDDRLTVTQIKEKFGGIRIHYQITDGTQEEWEVIRGVVEEAERKSFQTCEICGHGGDLRNNRGVYKTLCDRHADGQPPIA